VRIRSCSTRSMCSTSTATTSPGGRCGTGGHSCRRCWRSPACCCRRSLPVPLRT
jgi:hypothetical protein